MKKYSVIALLLLIALAVTGCSNPATFGEAKAEKYVTLGEYKGLPYTPEDTSVSDYDLAVALNEKLSENGYEDDSADEGITEGTVQIGDTVNIDYVGTKDGVAFSGGTAEGASLTIGSGQFIDGFEEGLAGVAIGSTVDLNLTFPANYDNAELAGADVVFKVTVNFVISRPGYPEFTDAIAQKMDETVKTAAEYKENLKKELETQNISNAKANQRSDLWSAAIANAVFTEKLPQKLLAQMEQEFTDYYTMLSSQSGYETLESWLSASNYSMDTFNKQAAQYAESMVQSQLTAYAIANAEGYTVTDEIFDTKAAEFSATNGYEDVDQYIAAVGEDSVKDQIILDFAVDLVVENAKINEK